MKELKKFQLRAQKLDETGEAPKSAPTDVCQDRRGHHDKDLHCGGSVSADLSGKHLRETTMLECVWLA